MPSNVHFAGWFIDTVIPGDKGLSIIDGHIVVGRDYEGIFQDLANLKADDRYTITFGDDSVRDFVVVSVQTIDNDNVADVLFSQAAGISNQLNLITCGGDYDKEQGQYSKRVVVISKYDGSTT